MPDPTRRLRRSAPPADVRTEESICRDLRARGVAPALARPLASRIAPRAATLADDAYRVFLDGVAAAHGAGGDGSVASDRTSLAEASAAELQRLMQDFAVELKKLDEGLRLLSAYLLRIRDRATRETSRTIH